MASGQVPASSSPLRNTGGSSPYRDPFKSSSSSHGHGSSDPLFPPEQQAGKKATSSSQGGMEKKSSSHKSSDPLRDYVEGRTSNSILTQRNITEPRLVTSDDATRIWGTNIEIDALLAAIVHFLGNFKLPNQPEPFYPQLMKYLAVTGRSDMNIDAAHLHSFRPDVYTTLVDYPAESCYVMDIGANKFYNDNIKAGMEDPIHITFIVRVFNLLGDTKIREMRPTIINKFVSIVGMVVRVSKIIPEMTQAYFQCDKCLHERLVVLKRGRILEPSRCETCGKAGGYRLMHNRSKYENKQILKLQEPPESVPEGDTPTTIPIVLFETLIDYVVPGDRVIITGIYKAEKIRLKSTLRACSLTFKPYIDCVHVRKVSLSSSMATNEMDRGLEEFTCQSASCFNEGQQQEDADTLTEKEQQQIIQLSQRPDIYQLLTRSVAPSVYATSDVKKGLLCQLVGGCHTEGKNVRTRGEINILLCGDPGVAKSQLLTFINKIVPRGIYTSGRGSSSVGLTAYISRDLDTGEPVLESGALVLSDRGVCCIDEFDKMADSTKSILHEVMEQQTVSIAKTGIICTLNARTAVLAAANPVQSKWDPTLSVAGNINLEPTLMSRFDLMYVLLDKADPKVDTYLAKHICSLYTGVKTTETSDGLELYASLDEEVLPVPLLTKYLTVARKYSHPTISNSAATKLVDAYTELRSQAPGRISITTRQLESLLRISEALAKLKMETEVDPSHVDEAVRLWKDSIQMGCQTKDGFMDFDRVYSAGNEKEKTELDELRSFLLRHEHEISGKVSISVLRKHFQEERTASSTAMEIDHWKFIDMLQRLGNKIVDNNKKVFLKMLQEG